MEKPHVTLIAACDVHRAIGKRNTLPWRHRGDMKFFKETTTGNTVVMGAKTYESMGSKPLPNRLNIVMTRDPSRFEQRDDVFFVTSVEEALAHEINGKLYVIGGEQIYKLFLPYADEVLLTSLDLEIKKADAFFPGFEIDFTLVDSRTMEAGETHAEDVKATFHTFKRN